MGSLKVKFWGTRGLVSSPGKDTCVYGGNTTCIQISDEKDSLIIDAGFGISNLGEQIMNKAEAPLNILFTHFHWDHIQGLPFFHPIYFPESKINLLSPFTREVMFKSLDILFDGSYSPFEGINNMPAAISFYQIPQNFKFGPFRITFARTKHIDKAATIPTFAYHIEHESGESVFVVLDHEATQEPINQKIVNLGTGCDFLIHDAQFTDQEYVNKTGWGHSSVSGALENAKQMGAKLSLLTHHDPSRTDKEIEAIIKDYQSRQEFEKVNFEFAKEEFNYTSGAVRNGKKAS